MLLGASFEIFGSHNSLHQVQPRPEQAILAGDKSIHLGRGGSQ